MSFQCTYDGCIRTFTRIDNFRRHEKGHTIEKLFKCSKCQKEFNRKENHQRHELICSKNLTQLPTSSGGSGIQLPPTSSRPSRSHPRQGGSVPSKFKILKTQTAFSKANVTWSLKYNQNHGDGYMNLIDSSTSIMETRLQRYVKKYKAIKFNMSLHVIFEQAVDPEIVTSPPVVLVTEQFECYANADIGKRLQECSKQLENRIESYEGMGSGWVTSNLVALDTLYGDSIHFVHQRTIHFQHGCRTPSVLSMCKI